MHDGFPNPAADSSLQPLDLNQLLIKNPIATYFVRVAGNILIVDRSLTPKPNDRVVWAHQDQISTSSLKRMPVEAELWGIVTAQIIQHRWESS